MTNTATPKAKSKSDRAREFLVEVASFLYYCHPSPSITVNDPVRLIREPQNRSGPNTIRIELMTSELIGFVSPRQAAEVAQCIDAGAHVHASIAFIADNINCQVLVAIADSEVTLERFLLGKKERILQRLSAKLEALFFHRAAKLGHPPAQHFVGTYYLTAQKKLPEALHWLGQASRSGHNQATELIATLYRDGVREFPAIKEDRWLRIFADAGHSEAQYNLACACILGTNGFKDPPKAVALLRAAAEQGHHKSQLRLAFMYEVGDDVCKNPEKAAFWRAKAESTRITV